MRLFKCYDSEILEDKDQVVVLWARNENEALNRVAEICEYLDMYDDSFETVLSKWNVEEYYPANDCDVFVAYPKDICKPEDVKIIFVPFNVVNPETYVMDELIEIESHEEIFREFVEDISISMSLTEQFYYLDGNFIFEPSLTDDEDIDVRQDIKEKAIAANKRIDHFVDEIFLANVNEFFKDNNGFRNEYLSYIFSDDEPFFDDQFYTYVCRKLMLNGDWLTYQDIHRVDFVAD